ncbi:MAG TPA: DinB family protein [Opitutaceae bacterium]|uniref:DinB family protein n=1 Tax=uncultured Nocardioides sp. TaxID=198441 RepID=UPI002606461F|nr:DinB family protein [uncultured Nocardioides sp.]HRD60680.1 DinB family protein [Nocardioides sp.]HRJ47665.1 DinB family protein [Opitutaceae bacterium]
MSDMWLPPGEDPREITEQPRGERAVVEGYLRHYRQTFELKLAGLDAEQLARRSVPPSTMSLLGLLRHLASVEMSWNRRVLQDRMELERPYREGGDRDGAFNGAVATEECVAEAWESWRREVAEAEVWLDGDDYDRVVRLDGDEIEVRDIVVHLVEEYARHCGHADLLRECIDGRTGQ